MAALQLKVLCFSINSSGDAKEFPRTLAIGISSENPAMVNGKELLNGALLDLRLSDAEDDSGSQIVTYIATDHVNLKGRFQFEIRHKKEVLLSADIEEQNCLWKIECRGGLKSGIWRSMLSMELGIVGNCFGSSVILSKSVILRENSDLSFGKRRKTAALQSISEEDVEQKLCIRRPQSHHSFWISKLLWLLRIYPCLIR